MTSFKDLKFEPHPAGLGGVRATHDFPNGYGVSVIQTSFSYGGESGKYELAVMDKNGVCYTTPVTSDVEGHLSKKEVTELMLKVQALPQQEEA